MCLILLDLQMPDMDGCQVIEALKKFETDGYLPVLVIAAQLGRKLRALKAGAKDFVSKPYDLVEVQARIHILLEVRLLCRWPTTTSCPSRLCEQTVLELTVELRASEARFQRFSASSTCRSTASRCSTPAAASPAFGSRFFMAMRPGAS